jgi:hypothetical protein
MTTIPIKPPEWALQRLIQDIGYNPISGLLYWKRNNIKAHRRAGEHAGNFHDDYCRLTMGYKGKKIRMLAHHVIWFLMTGVWPDHIVDHKNRNGLDNRWENLRPATLMQNRHNSSAQHNNKTGVQGVTFRPVNQKYAVRINIDGKRVFVGHFETLEEAAQARRLKAIEHYGEFAPYQDDGSVNRTKGLASAN